MYKFTYQRCSILVMKKNQFEVLPTSQARAELSAATSHFRLHGLLSQPVLFGSQRRAEGAIISFELFEQLLPEIESIQLSEVLRQRINDGLPRISFEELVHQVGLDPSNIK